MPNTFFDTHFHLDEKTDMKAVVSAADEVGVRWMLAAGTSVGRTQEMLDRIAPHPNVYAAVGVHPHEAEQFDGELEPYNAWHAQKQVVAVGEIGLDYFYDHSPRKQQQVVFRQFLDQALALKRPAVIHVREAYDDGYALLKEFSEAWTEERIPFVVHCFSGPPDWAERFLALGGMLSYTGLITFPKAQEIRDSLKVTPLNRVMFETDSPYLAPKPHRGRRNQPAYVVHVVERAAEELGISIDELAFKSTQNALQFYDISGE